MNKFEAWTITLALVLLITLIPRWFIRWALICFVGVPLAVALLLAII
jgi:hypothetical protein